MLLAGQPENLQESDLSVDRRRQNLSVNPPGQNLSVGLRRQNLSVNPPWQNLGVDPPEAKS